LPRRRAGDDADNVSAPAGTLVDDRLDRAEAVPDQHEAVVALLPEKFQCGVEIGQAILEKLISRSAELGEIAGT
jgi:hypothetical protein